MEYINRKNINEIEPCYEQWLLLHCLGQDTLDFRVDFIKENLKNNQKSFDVLGTHFVQVNESYIEYDDYEIIESKSFDSNTYEFNMSVTQLVFYRKVDTKYYKVCWFDVNKVFWIK